MPTISALRALLGEGPSLSASSVQRLKEQWAGQYEQWRNTPIEEAQLAYAWADGLYVKAGRAILKSSVWVS